MGSLAARRFSYHLLASTALTGIGALLASGAATAGQLPTGYATAYGSVGFRRASGTLTINQGTPAAIVNYDSFSIGRRNRVTVHQPGVSSVLLNRVTGSTTSVIAGRLSANGQVYLVNPNGIAITKSGVVKVGGGFVASSLAISDDDFVNGRRQFAGNGHSARVSNAGTITIGRRGYAALIGGEVRNTGTIAVPMGTVALGSGEMATLDVSGDGFMQVAVPTASAAKGALITDTGRISGVTVMVDAATARAAARNAVNISGSVDSHTISGHSGAIQIGGGDGGAVAVSGRLSVASRRGKGGSVTITGTQIALTHARVTAQGARGGGTVRIGGDRHGGGTLPHAGTVTVDARSVIDADATRAGDGGNVTVWSDTSTSFAGRILARGGVFGGNGGSAEISGGTLALTGTANVTAPRGALGTILLDPRDLTITSTSNGTSNIMPANGTSPNVASNAGGTTTDSYITPAQIQALSGNVDIQTTRDLTVASSVSYGNGNLTLEAGRNVTVNSTATVAVSKGALTLTAASSAIPGYDAGGALSINGNLNAGSALTLNGSGITQSATSVITTPVLDGSSSAATVLTSRNNAIQGIGSFNQTGGDFQLTTSAPTLTFGVNGGVIQAATGSLTFVADQVASATSGPNVQALNGAVTLAPFTPGRRVELIGATAPDSNSLSINQAFVDTIGAFRLALGNAGTTGPINIANAGETVDLTGHVGTLQLRTTGAVTEGISSGAQNGGGTLALAVNNLTGSAGSIALGAAANSVNTIGFGDGIAGEVDGLSATNGSLTVRSASGLLVGNTVSASGSLTVQSGGDLKTYASFSADGDLALQSGGIITILPEASFAGPTISLTTAAPITISASGTTSAGNQVYSPTFVETQLANGSLTLATTGGAVTVASPVSYATGTTLTLSGSTALTVGAGITATNSGLALVSGGTLAIDAPVTAADDLTLTSGGTITTGAAGTVSVAHFILTAGAWTQNATSLPAFTAGDFQVQGGSFLRATGGTGTAGSPYLLTDIYGVQGVATLLASNFQLANNIDASGTRTWNAGAGFVPIGTASTPYYGAFDGLGNTISNIAISSNAAQVGVFGVVGVNGTVKNVGIVGGSVAAGSNTAYVGGLVGRNSGLISQSFATDAVIAPNVSDFAGGLVGYAFNGTVQNSYATGAVTGGFNTGGLVGLNSGTINQAYATGAVSVGGKTGATAGGLAGFSNGTIMSSAFDILTSGQTAGVGGANASQSGVTALTTAQLQSTATANPFGANSGFSGGAAGLGASTAATAENGVYPYLTSFFPNGVQAVSGFAYKDAGLNPLDSPAASNGLPATQRPGTVSVTAGTTTLATVTTGANGYYYTAVAAGSLPAGTIVAGSTVADTGANGSGAANAVSFTSSQGAAANIPGLNVYGGYATYGSYSPSLAATIAAYPAALQAAEGASPTIAAVAPGLAPGYLALGPSFALDAQPAANAIVAGGDGFAITTPTTITGPLTLVGSSIAVDAPVTVNGGQLTLNTDAAGTLTFAAPLQYNPSGANQSLTIDGHAYTLITNEAQLVALNGTGNGTYDALAASFTSTSAAGAAYAAAPIATYAGTLEGLGNTITGLRIAGANNVGLVGTLGAGGTLRDIGLVGGSVQGGNDVGMLVGANVGAIVNAYATGAVNGSIAAGGLVGANSGTIARSHATVSVLGVSGVGGLVGANTGAIAGSYAIGAVRGDAQVGGFAGYDNGAIATSYATGAVSGAQNVGGLVGSAYNDAIFQVYATGPVSGPLGLAGVRVGGLVGQLNGGTITQGYASGAVSAGGGGFVGIQNGSTITASYYDMGTTGQTTAGVNVTSGVTGLSTPAARGGLGNYPGFTAGDWYQTADLRPILTAEAAPTVAGVTTIGNSHQLELVGANLGGTYVLPQNVDVSDTSGSASGVFSTNGFDPLGGNNGANFTGTFDGLGHTLTGLTVARPTANAGLFGINAGTIRYVGLVGGTVSGSVAGDLAGQNQGTILQSFATGTVQANRLGGGLVGEMSGSAASISQSFATGAVTGNSSAAVGGFVGQLQGGTITASYAQGSVTQTAPDTVLGGFVAAVGDAVINQAYATGMVTGGPNSAIAGFAASIYGNHASITSAYFDSATTGQTTGVVYNNGGTVNVTALSSQATPGSATDAFTNANYVGFDQTVWAPASRGTPNYYPQLYGVSGVVGVKDPNATSVYGTTPNVAANAPTYYGLGPYNTLTSPATVSTAANAQSDVGTYAITSTGTAATYTPGTTYLGPATRIVDLPGTLTITPATLTVSALNGITKTYDGTTALPPGAVSYTFSGVVNGDSVGVAAASDVYDSPNAGMRMIDATGLTITGAKATDYMLSAPSVTSTGTIIPAPLTVTGAKSYDGTAGFVTGQLAVAGAVNGETITLTQGTGTSPSPNAGTYAGAPLSNLAVSVSGGNALASNYSLPGSGTLVIGKATITVAGATGVDKTYDGTTALPNGATGFNDTGVLASDAGQVSVTAASAMYDSPNAGQRMVDVAGLTLSGAAAGNYVLSSTSVVGSGTIIPAPLTVSGAKTYDGMAGFTTGQLAVAGAVNGETIMLTQGTGTAPSASAGTYMGAPLSNLAISVSGGNMLASNYMLPGTGTLVIGKATISVAGATGIDKTYNGTTALPNGATGFNDSGILASDAGRVSVTATSAMYDSPNAGPRMVDVAGLALSGAAAGNYVLSATSVTGSGTITPAALTVSGAKAYDGTAGFATGQLAVAGAVNGETIMLTQGNGTAPSADAGTYSDGALSNLAIAVSGGNAMASNYSLPGSGTLVIGKATITVAGAAGIDKTYDATTALPNGATGFTYTGEANGDVTVTARGAMYDSPDAGSRMIDVVGLTLSGAAAGNYVLSSTSVTGSGTITPAPVTVTANGGRSIYGNDPSNPGLSASGLQGGQGVSVLTGLSNSFGIDGRTHAGSYTLTVAGASSNGNYQVVAKNDGTFTVDPRALTIAANDQSRRYGAANLPLTYTVGGMGLVNGDALTGALTTTATRASGKGSYPIDQGTLAATSDYVVTYVPGTLTVGPAPAPAPTLTSPAVDLASTADRAVLEVVGQPSDALPFVLDLLSGDGPLGARIVAGLGDPRFADVVVCARDFCTIIAPKPRKSLRTSQLETP